MDTIHVRKSHSCKTITHKDIFRVKNIYKHKYNKNHLCIDIFRIQKKSIHVKQDTSHFAEPPRHNSGASECVHCMIEI